MRRRRLVALLVGVAASLSVAGCKVVSLDNAANEVAANAFSATANADGL